MTNPQIEALGDRAFIIRLSHALDLSANSRARALSDSIRAAAVSGITDVVPANSSVGVYFSTTNGAGEIRDRLTALLATAAAEVPEPAMRIHEIPVSYNGPDLSDVASRTGLSTDAVIEIHSSREYRVFAVGFAPGFGYLGEVDERIAVPRRAEPRPRVAAGSVAIANRQTAIYPMNTPGGWNLIGTTDTRIFDIQRDPPSLFAVGDSVRFVPL